jgi:CubicO group peptidase (beta-lactamase class C family)
VQAAFAGNFEAFALPGVAWHVEAVDSVHCGSWGHECAGGPTLDPEQRWHWGSCTKALTATVIYALVREGKLDWDAPTPFGTIRQLAQHRSGVVTDLASEKETKLLDEVGSLPAREQRKAFVALLSQEERAHESGERFGPYSNAGYVVLAHLAEEACDESWEALVHRTVSVPLGLTTLGFGTASGAKGHDEDGLVDTAEDAAWHQSSFSMHSSLSDWAAFARAHLVALHGQPLLNADATVLHTPASPQTTGEPFDGPEQPMSYAMGWKCVWEEDGEEKVFAEPTGVLWHWGTNFRFNSGCYVDSARKLLIVAATNSGSSMARLAMKLAFDGVLAASSEKF